MPDPSSAALPRPRGKWIAAVIVVALVLLYLVWPYYSVWRFGESIRAHDMAALGEEVDFPAVRGSLKQQLRDKFFSALSEKQRERFTKFISTSASDPLDELVEAYINPEGLAALISDPARLKNASSVSSIPSLDRSVKSVDWSKFGNAFFTSPRDFALDHEGIKLRFRFTGTGWKLHAVDLQLQKKS